MNSLFSHVLWTTTQPVATMIEKKSHLVSLHPLFFDFSLFSFRWVRVLSYVCQRQPARTLQNQSRTNAHFNELLNSKPISDFGETLSRKDGGQKGILKQAESTKPQTLAETGVILR